ncbi:MAG: isoleucine--tRNA ligase, partial [Solirubrobacterales bacterium]
SHAAVAAGPEIEYVRARTGDEVVIVARPLVERVLGEEAELLAHFPGTALEGVRYEAPFEYIKGEDFGALGHSVLMADFVSTEDGTGLVHTALAFGEDDFRLGERYGMTLQNPVRDDGTYDERVPDFQGKFVFEHNPEIVEALRARGRLFRAEEYEHAYPHCWRCGTPLIYYAKSSWYVATSALRDLMLEVNEGIDWHPDHIKHGRFGKWLEGNVDWALSRERYWGTPLPIWECTDCDERWCAGSVAEIRERGGEVPGDLHRPYIDEMTLRCESCGGEMRRVVETIDAWFDSGSMPFAQFHHPFENTAEFESRFPADYICEGIDQTRGWFYSLLAVATQVFGRGSYEHCVCLGLIADPEGQKMSKSRGNVVDPWEVIDRHGADAFRWYYLTSQQPWAGYRFSVDTVGESVRQFMLTLWNTYSFFVLYANAESIGPSDLDEAELGDTELDRWIVSHLQSLKRLVIDDLDGYDCTRAGGHIAQFVDQLSNWYVRLSRRRFWDGDRAAFATLRHCLLELAKLLAPFTPFIADAMYSNLRGDGGSVHLADYPEPDASLEDGELEAGIEAAMRAIELGRAARAKAKIKVRQPLATAVIVATDIERVAIERLADLVRAELNVKELEFVSEQGELVSYAVKPNYRTLGPRFGKLMPQVAAAIEAIDPAHVADALRDGRRIGINVDGHDHELEPEDIGLAMEAIEGFEVEVEAGRAVALSLEVDDALRREGLAREVVHAVQAARRDAGLDVSDRIELALGGDDALLDAARAHEAYVTGETLAVSISYDGAGAGTEARIEGRELRIAVERAG